MWIPLQTFAQKYYKQWFWEKNLNWILLERLFLVSSKWFHLNPLHPNISIHILNTIHHTFPKVLTRRICLIIKSCSSISSFLITLMFDLGVILYGEIRCWSVLEIKGLSDHSMQVKDNTNRLLGLTQRWPWPLHRYCYSLEVKLPWLMVIKLVTLTTDCLIQGDRLIQVRLYEKNNTIWCEDMFECLFLDSVCSRGKIMCKSKAWKGSIFFNYNFNTNFRCVKSRFQTKIKNIW